jgi:hypothetical protein
MKKIIKKLGAVAILIGLSSCSKETCEYIKDCKPVEPEGFMVNTFNMSSISNVGAIYKTTYNSKAPVGNDWNATALGANKVVEVIPPRWDVSDIGQVFGIALDNSGGIYLSASKLYNIDYNQVPSTFGTAGSAGIYKTDVNSLSTVDFVTTDVFSNTNTVGTNKIPNSDASLGNIAFDKEHNQLFVTNLEDGRIYRIDATTGIVKSIFDPFTLDSGTSGMVAAGEQLWGIRVLHKNNKSYVYFARTLTEILPNSFNGSDGTKEIWSIELDNSGEFLASEIGSTKLFIGTTSQPVLQINNVPGSQAKITDIAFSCSGKMLLAERGGPHVSGIFEFIYNGSSWVMGNNFYTGSHSKGNNSAGGVDYGDREISGSFNKDDIVWATANYMTFNGFTMYGVQGIASTGNSPILPNNGKTDIFIDYDHIYNTDVKGGLGDVEIFDSSCPCNSKSTLNQNTDFQN